METLLLLQFLDNPHVDNILCLKGEGLYSPSLLLNLYNVLYNKIAGIVKILQHQLQNTLFLALGTGYESYTSFIL